MTAWAADEKLTALTESTTVADANLLYIVSSQATTPLSQKMTVINLFDTIDSSAKFSAIITDETGSGVSVFGTAPTFTTEMTLTPVANPTTDTDGEWAIDIDGWGANFDAFEFFNGTASAYFVATTASDTPSNGQVPKFNTGGAITWENDNDSGGATAWDDIGDPDNSGLTTITFDNAELSLLTGDNDAAASFFTIQNTDADHTGGNLYLLDLDFSADDGDVDADYIKCQDSGGVVFTVQQDGDLASNGSLGAGTFIDITPTASQAHSEGRMYYDSDVDTFVMYNAEADVSMNVGEEMWAFVRNATGSTINDGQVVYFSGATGNRPNIILAKADAAATSLVMGVATHDIENNTDGYVTTFGLVRGAINTSGMSGGDVLYLSAASAGGLTTTAPTEPDFIVMVATVTTVNANGDIFVCPQIDYTDGVVVNELSTVGDLKVFGDDLFMNTNTDKFILVADGTNFNPVESTGDVIISNDGSSEIQADSVALTTDTTGDYVASITDGDNGIDGGDGGSEGAALTLSFDASEIDAETWSDGANASNVWTFDLSGTDHTMTAKSAMMAFSHDVNVVGDLFVMGDDITATTNTTGALWVGDNTNFNPVVMGGDVSIAANGTATVASGAVLLDEIGNPAGDSALTMGNNNIVFTFGGNDADNNFEINITGSNSGDGLHVHQHTGNPTAGHLVHFEGDDPDVNVILEIGVHGAGDVSGTDVNGLLISSDDNDDADYVPFLIMDDADGTPDLLFQIDYTGSVEVGIWTATVIDHERGGLEADVSGFSGLLAIEGGSTGEIDAKSELEGQIADVDDFAEADGDVYTGVHDFGGATSIEIVNGTDPDVTVVGQISLDSDGANEPNDITIRTFEGSGTQYAIASTLKHIQGTVVKPNDFADATRDKFMIFSNETGMTLTIVKIEAWADVDDTAFAIEVYDADGAANNATVDELNCTTGTGPYTDTETTITAGVIAANRTLFIDFDDTDDPGWVKWSIVGWLNADVD